MYILFDIGGTKMRVAGSNDCKTIIGDPIVEKTPTDFEEGFAQFANMIKKVAGEEAIEIIGGGIGGPFQERTCSLIASPQLAGWVGNDLQGRTEEEFNTKVFIENDSAIVGLGEMHLGAGVGYEIGAYMTVSTGVGGAKFERGVIDTKAAAFEPGHQIIDAGGALCPECSGNTLWHYISGQATEERLNIKPYEIEDESFWDEYAKWLAIGLYNTTLHWSPDVIVLGGSMIIGKPSISVEKTKEYLNELVRSVIPVVPEVKEATLGDFGGLHGAMVYINQKK